MGSFDLGTGLLDGFIRYRGYSGDPYSSLEDFSDRLSHFLSSLIILLLAGVTTTNVYFLRPISCTLPTAPDGHFTVFAESVCWLQGTIGLNVDDNIPNEPADWDELRERSDISYIALRHRVHKAPDKKAAQTQSNDELTRRERATSPTNSDRD
nr:unnamed protein product [Spirometra erinaceieuropaei]